MKLLDFISKVKPSYIADWYHGLLAETLQQAVAEGKDVLCSGPPGCGKTELFSILFPSWLIEENPGTHIISLANSDGLSRMAAGNILRIVRSLPFKEIQPVTLDKATEATFLVSGNDGRPTLHAAGINGQLSGHRAEFIIYDDLTKNLADAYSETVRERTWNNFLSCVETRLLPEGHIYGIQTRWTLDDVHGRLIRAAEDNPDARQFLYINLAASNSGEQSYILDTKTHQKEFFKRTYRSLATKVKQPYSFTPAMLKSKEANLGPTLYQALYQGNPVASENQLFPPDVWGTVEGISQPEYGMIVSAWDTAARDKATNDPSCNVVIGRRHSGDFVVLDYAEFRLTFDKLLPVVYERDRALAQLMGQVPLLVIEEASSGQQLIDVFRSQWPNIPLLAVKPTRSKIIRAEAVTPFTTARLVKLLKANWNGEFIAKFANFPASDDDHVVDAGVMALRTFTSRGADYKDSETVVYLRDPSTITDEELIYDALEEL